MIQWCTYEPARGIVPVDAALYAEVDNLPERVTRALVGLARDKARASLPTPSARARFAFIVEPVDVDDWRVIVCPPSYVQQAAAEVASAARASASAAGPMQPPAVPCTGCGKADRWQWGRVGAKRHPAWWCARCCAGQIHPSKPGPPPR